MIGIPCRSSQCYVSLKQVVITSHVHSARVDLHLSMLKEGIEDEPQTKT